MEEGNKKALAKSLAQVAIVSLSASLGGAGVGAVLLEAATEGASQWLDKVTARWNEKESDFIQVAQQQLPALADELSLSDETALQEFHQALAAIQKAPISAATFAKLDFDARRAAAHIAEESGIYRVQSPEQPAHKILVRLYELLPHDSGQIRAMDVAFQQSALALLHSHDDRLRRLAGQIGWAALLYTPSTPWRRRPTEAMLLDAAAAIVPYFPRPEDDELDDWFHGEDDIALRLYEAEGGAGKTRWMLEQCRRLSAAGWRTGFLTGDAGAQEAPARAYETLFDGRIKTLIVIDYAETRGEQLNKLLNAAQKAPRGCHLRIALLTRRLAGQWWPSLRNRLDRDAIDLLDEYPPGQQALPPFFLDGEERQAAFYASAWWAFHEALSQRNGAIRNDDPAPPAFEGEHFKLPLFVSLAALDRLLGGSGAGDEQALLQRLLNHEKRHWRREGVEPEAVSQAMATLTLWQGASREQLETLPQRWRDSTALRDQKPHPLYALLSDLYGQTLEDGQTRIAPLRPDRLGETLVEEALKSDAEALAEAAFATGVSAPALKQGFTVLGRLPLRATEHLKTVGGRLATVLKDEGDLGFILQLLDALPEQSLGLAEFAAEMTKYALERLKANSDDDIGSISEVARLSGNLSVRHSELGQREAALSAAQEAVELYRKLSRERPDAFTPDLAGSLNNLAKMLSDLGQREAALSTAQEAVELYRKLSRERPDAFTPDLARSLGALGQILRVDEPLKARDCFAEGIKTLTPAFLRYPTGLAGLMGALAGEYLATAEQLGEAPDEALLAPVVEVFTQLQADEEAQD